jgi:CheY-like chemotaxis protein
MFPVQGVGREPDCSEMAWSGVQLHERRPAGQGDTGVAKSILIVDDSKLARIVVGKAVAAVHPGWERLEAASAADALEILQSRDIDVVILDYNMPGQNGLELAQEIRSRWPETPVAVATANVQDEVIARAHAANAAFVPKPITEETLRPFLEGAALRLQESS